MTPTWTILSSSSPSSPSSATSSSPLSSRHGRCRRCQGPSRAQPRRSPPSSYSPFGPRVLRQADSRPSERASERAGKQTDRQTDRDPSPLHVVVVSRRTRFSLSLFHAGGTPTLFLRASSRFLSFRRVISLSFSLSLSLSLSLCVCVCMCGWVRVAVSLSYSRSLFWRFRPALERTRSVSVLVVPPFLHSPSLFFPFSRDVSLSLSLSLPPADPPSPSRSRVYIHMHTRTLSLSLSLRRSSLSRVPCAGHSAVSASVPKLHQRLAGSLARSFAPPLPPSLSPAVRGTTSVYHDTTTLHARTDAHATPRHGTARHDTTRHGTTRHDATRPRHARGKSEDPRAYPLTSCPSARKKMER